MRLHIYALAVLLAFGLSASSFAQTQSQPPPEYDVIIRGGTVFDGSGLAGELADVGIVDDRVMQVGDLKAARAKETIDATGRFVTPGFVSIHDHSAPEAFARPTGLLSQGITTAITNPDGKGPLDIVRQFDQPEGLGLNYGAYIGFNSIWQEVVGQADRRPTLDQIARMRELVDTALRAGAFGVSAGLDYKPGYWATTGEVIAVLQAAKPWRTNFPNHERVYEGNGYSSIAGIQETLRIAEESGVAAVVTHMKLQGSDRGKSALAFAAMAAARNRGTFAAADAYPYTFGSTALEQLLIPSWAQEGGREEMFTRFKDPVLRKEIIAETKFLMDTRWTGPGGVYLPDTKEELIDVMRDRGVSDPGEMVVRLLEEGRTQVLLRYGTEEDLVNILRDPLTAVSCDCGASMSQTGHPRHWGSYPRFLGRYVRDQQIMSWGEAVRRMTALPAAIVGLSERGYLLPGMIADITIFDPKTIVDRSTLDKPVTPSEGVFDVLVNGQLALSDGKPTLGTFGVRLARSRHEPTRAMAFDIHRKLRVSGQFGDGKATIAAALTQLASSRQPSGSVTISLPNKPTFNVEPSILQVAQGWASVTGVAEVDGTQQPVTIWAESADPESGQPSVTISVAGIEVFTGPGSPGSVHVNLYAQERSIANSGIVKLTD